MCILKVPLKPSLGEEVQEIQSVPVPMDADRLANIESTSNNDHAMEETTTVIVPDRTGNTMQQDKEKVETKGLQPSCSSSSLSSTISTVSAESLKLPEGCSGNASSGLYGVLTIAPYVVSGVVGGILLMKDSTTVRPVVGYGLLFLFGILFVTTPVLSLRDSVWPWHKALPSQCSTPTTLPTIPTPCLAYQRQTLRLVGILVHAAALLLLSSQVLQSLHSTSLALGMLVVFHLCEAIYSLAFAPQSKAAALESRLALPVILILLLVVRLEPSARSLSMVTSLVVCRMLRFVFHASSPEILTESTKPTEPATPARTNVWNIYGHSYDVTDFVHHHPGGVEAIMLAANRSDATALFQSYHSFTIVKARQVLEKYRIDTTAENTPDDNLHQLNTTNKSSPRFPHPNDLFYSVLCERVADALKDKANIDVVRHPEAIRATTGRYLVYLFYVTGMVASCYAHSQGSYIGAVFAGVFGWLIGGIGHDGGHFAVSRTAWINNVALWGISCLMNPILWQHGHSFAHHCHTNDPSTDPDMNFDDLLRYTTFNIKNFNATSETSDKNNNNSKHIATKNNSNPNTLYKLQSNPLWVLTVYSIIAISTCYAMVLKFTLDRGHNRFCTFTDRNRVSRTLQLMSHMLVHCYIFWILPFRAYRTSGIGTTLAILLPMMISSILFGLFSQVGHIHESAMDRRNEANYNKRHLLARSSWAADQIESTVDFCPQNKIMFYLSNGLSMQIEHHLFPLLNHCHLKHIQPTVELTCKEFNVSYNKFATWTDSWTAMCIHLKQMANTEP